MKYVENESCHASYMVISSNQMFLKLTKATRSLYILYRYRSFSKIIAIQLRYAGQQRHISRGLPPTRIAVSGAETV